MRAGCIRRLIVDWGLQICEKGYEADEELAARLMPFWLG